MPRSVSQKHSHIKTLMITTFPSELSAPSPLLKSAETLKQEEAMKTPISPPVAYTEFLRNYAEKNAEILAKQKDRDPDVSDLLPLMKSKNCKCYNYRGIRRSPTERDADCHQALPPAQFSPSRISSSSSSVDGDSMQSSTSGSQSRHSSKTPDEGDMNKAEDNYFHMKSSWQNETNVCQVREIVTRSVTHTRMPQVKALSNEKGGDLQ